MARKTRKNLRGGSLQFDETFLQHLSFFCGTNERQQQIAFLQQQLKLQNQMTKFKECFDELIFELLQLPVETLLDDFSPILGKKYVKAIYLSKLAVFTFCLQHEIYPNDPCSPIIDPNFMQKINLELQKTAISYFDYIQIIYYLLSSSIPSNKHVLNNRLASCSLANKNRINFLILGKAAFLSFYNLMKLIYIERRINGMSLLPSGVIPCRDISSGPHGGGFDTNLSFTEHDIEHCSYSIYATKRLNWNSFDPWYDNIIQEFKSKHNDSGLLISKFYRMRLFSLFVWFYCFEAESLSIKDLNQVKNNLLQNPLGFLNGVDEYDIDYCLKYFIDSDDLPNVQREVMQSILNKSLTIDPDDDTKFEVLTPLLNMVCTEFLIPELEKFSIENKEF
jgi:hypothetical protein